jgi:hypothetical protein
MLYYAKIDFPWPLSDREMVMQTKLIQDPETRVVVSTSTAVSGHVSATKGIVRVTKCNAKWIIKPKVGNTVDVEYYLYSDPGGSLPDWLINLALDMGPRETVKKMRELLKLQRYHNVKLAHIKE